MGPETRAPRLHVAAPLTGGAEVALHRDQAHYLLTVMRRGAGDAVVLFNGREGEWAAVIADTGRRHAVLTVTERLRPQTAPVDLQYCFAPLKRARLDFIAQKATELGVAAILPVTTRHTVTTRVNSERLRSNAIEAAEQCGILWVPETLEPVPLERYLVERGPLRTLIFCDEGAAISDPIEALRGVTPGPLAVLIGPEGGFAEDERAMLLKAANVVRLSLGPRIMRADTAGIAALTLVQAVLGDWRPKGG